MTNDGGGRPKYETCKYALSVGQTAVYVTPECRRLSMIKGVLVSSKKRCEDCRSWKEKEVEIV